MDTKIKKGNLTIFFGYCAGVGKTYAMLNAAQQKSVEGVDVVIGYIEPHERKETTDLTYGLEKIEKKEINYKNHLFLEFNLEAALERHPQLILVDELAHNNAPTSTHKKRYSDVEELLRAGIDVYTTVNVQHLESLHDVVESITRIKVNERIPDHIFDEAYDVKLVDIEIEDLIIRLKEGKIYNPLQAKRALNHFFVKDNLIALREITLRRCADRINLYANNENKPFLKEHILVCIGTSPTNQKVIRTASKMAQAFHGEFIALYVETSTSKAMPQKAYDQLQSNLTLAKHLRANIVSTYGDDIAYQISQYAKTSGISKLVLGRSYQKKFLFKKQTIVDTLTNLSPNLEIYIIPDNNSSYQKQPLYLHKYIQFYFKDTLISIITLFATTVISFIASALHFDITSVVLFYVLSSCVIGMLTLYPIYIVISSLISICIINFFFINPKYSLFIASKENLLMVIVMVCVSFIINILQLKLKKEKNLASSHAYSMDVLLQASQRLQLTNSYEDIMKETCYQLYKLVKNVILFYPVKKDFVQNPYVYNPQKLPYVKEIYLSNKEKTVAKWVYTNNKNAGALTSTLSDANALYLAIRRNNKIYGVVGIGVNSDNTLTPNQIMLIKTLLNEISLAFDSIVKI
ncbi:DUF4118 domain-containing protein [Thomasclavelia sp.]|uniref:sensor histidine kinase n=1 Tax=Thomasclavelia sp. TaxID=3025757 RepID=UPI0026227339|nr:DUF4118 domain-containing protein [Thomasclavelia sp.]